MTVSGFSGGGTTAANMNVVWSDYIKGVGLMFCGPYGNQNDVPEGVDSSAIALKSIELATFMEVEDKIDNLTNLKDMPVWIQSGK